MVDERRYASGPRRRREVLLEAIYELARIECCRLNGRLAPKFRQAVEALEALDAAEAAFTQEALTTR